MASPAAALQLKIAVHDCLVTIDATSVPVRSILNEWARQGGTKVLGAERVTGAPLTLKLVDVPEAKALEVVLRSVAGYMAAPRSAANGASIYDRILVMATSTPPPAVVNARPGAPNPAMAGTQRFVPPQRQQQADDDADDPDPNPPNPPVFTFPGGANAQPGAGNVNAAPSNAFPQPEVTGQPVFVNPTQQAPSSYPSGIPIGSPTPGMISVPPQTAQPGTNVRPPGRPQ